jgi:hypothetical protein
LAAGKIGEHLIPKIGRRRAAASGAAAALVWAAVEPIDRSLLRHDYSDIAVLGKALTRTRAWPVAGVVMHAANGAIFGFAFAEVRRRRRVTALQLALVEHAALFPLGYLVDRAHPARGEPGLAPLFSARAFVQATWRHALFGAVVDRLAGRTRLPG